jgi:DMSO/TMAO reductase YedYZ molybdopterin-dependent catalytic subunit
VNLGSDIVVPEGAGRAHEAPAFAGLAVSGHVPRPRAFDLRELKGLPRHELGRTDVLCMTGREVARVDSYAGVRLTDVLDATGLSTLQRIELKRGVIVAHGLDSYRAFFSWNELFNTAIGKSVLVLYEREGQPLDAHMGTLALISAADSRLGPRHLRHLASVTVQML